LVEPRIYRLVPGWVRLLLVSFTQTFGHSFAKNKEYEKIDKFSPGQLSNHKLVQFRVQSCNFWHPDLIAKLLGAALIHKT
jgi:hypothetical protein